MQFFESNRKSRLTVYLLIYFDQKTKKYHDRSKQYNTRGTIIDRTMIDKRPKIVEKKSRIGDLEIDTVIGKNHIGALVTVVDRKSKFALIKNVPSKQADIV